MNKIYNCDYIDFLTDIQNESVSLVLTDPPFGINYQNNYTKKKHKVLTNDDKEFSYDVLAKESYRILKKNTCIFCFTGWSTYPKHFYELESSGFDLKEPIICGKKPSGTNNLYGTFQSNSDWVLFGHKGNFKFKQTKVLKNKRAGSIPNKGRSPVPEFKTRFPSCWFGEEFPYSSENPTFQSKNKIYHPTIKNLEFIKWLILLSTEENDLVVDPFLGSGTTAVACKQLNRQFLGCEINKEFYNYSLERIKKNI